MSMIEDIKERREFSGDACIFCDRDPYERVDVGVGSVPVAVTCCEPGIDLYQHQDKGLVNLSCRLQQMEAALLAAEELASAALDAIQNADRLGDYDDPMAAMPVSVLKDLNKALAAFRAATGGAA